MKKINIVSVILVSLFFLLPNVDAATSYTINAKCSIRTEPNEGGSFLVQDKIHYLDPNDVITLVDGANPVTSTSRSCSTKYYYVTYAGEKGYVCGDYINFNANGEYYQELKDAGFSDTYLLSLNALKTSHPNWVFKAIKTGLKWNDVIRVESSVGKNYISVKNPNTTDKIYLSLDGGSYDASTGTFIQQEAGDWYAANKYTVAYYIDPRNYLNDRDIFVFESNYYNSNYSDDVLTSATSKVFSNNTLNNYTGNFVSTKNIGINPVFLATRSRQEVAVDKDVSSAASGKSGYYNFFNIGAYSSCVNPVYCGNDFASNKGWTTASSAIQGGGYWIYTNYTEKNQQNLYFQKFNVNNSGNTYAHQYMTNITAPKSESDLMYKGYSTANSLQTTTTFYIPIYEEMPDIVSALPTSIDQDDLDNANSGNNPVTNTLSISEIVNGAGYSYSGSYMTGLTVGMTSDSLISSLKGMSNDANVSITSNGVEKNVIGTGDKITITNNGKTETLTAIIYGDTNGDGKVSVIDLLKVQKHLLNTAGLSDGYNKAADVDKDGKASVSDLLKVQKTILGTDSIKQ